MQLITDIQQQKKNKQRYSVFLDGEYAFSLSDELMLRFNLKIGAQVEKEQLSSMLVEDECKAAFNKGVDYISYCNRTVKQTRDYLLKKEFSEESIDFAIAKLEEYNFLNDMQYAESFVQNKNASALMGRAAIKFKLMQKGIEKQLTEEALEGCFDEKAELAAAQAFVQKNAKKYEALPLRERNMKLSTALARRGFGWDIVRQAISIEEEQDYD